MSEDTKTEAKTKSKKATRSYADAARKNKTDTDDVPVEIVETTTETTVEASETKPQRRGRKQKDATEKTEVVADPTVTETPVETQETPQVEPVQERRQDSRPRYDNNSRPQYDNNRRPQFNRNDRPRNFQQDRQDRQPDQPYHTDEDLAQMSREELIETVKKQDRIISALQRRRQQFQNQGRYPNQNRGYQQNRYNRDDDNGERQFRGNDNRRPEYNNNQTEDDSVRATYNTGRPRFDNQSPDRRRPNNNNVRPGRPQRDEEYSADRFRERFPNRHASQTDE